MEKDQNELASDELRDEARKAGIDVPASSKEDEEAEEESEETDADDESEDDEEEKPKDKSDIEDKSDDDDSEESEDEEEAEESDDEDEEESDEDDSNKPKPRKYIPIKKHQSEKAAWRAEKETFITTISKLQTDMEALAKKVPETISPERQKLLDEIKKADPDFNPSNLNATIDVIKAELGKTGKVSGDLEARITAITEFMEKSQKIQRKDSDQRYFNTQWSGLLPTFEKDFPRLSEEQKDVAKKAMDKIWHTKEFFNKDIDYVYFKNKSKFDAIISPRKKGLETGRTQGYTAAAQKNGVKLSTSPSSKELREAEKLMIEVAPDGDDLVLQSPDDSTL